MANFRQQLEDMTHSANEHFKKEGRYPGSTVHPDSLRSFDEADFRRYLHSAAISGKDYYYMMVIEPEHQGEAKLFDPLEHSPDNKWWPHEELLKNLKGRAKAVCCWAISNGLAVTLSDVKKHDPVRGEYAREYWLVVNWSQQASVKAA